jgi:g-D-glutamyl-meso-diaminopimelate peptidase
VDIYQEIKDFYERTKTEKRIIGKSALGRNIYALKMGNGSPVGIAQYAIHGREWITAKLAIAHFSRGVRGSFWIVPLANPDGCLLSQKGLESVKSEKEKARLIALNGGEDFRLWKANARGVDLNVNFPARWGTGAKNTKICGGENYVGKKPCSESETRALMRFTKKISPDYTVSYHTKGEEIYWYFYQSMRTCLRDKRLAAALSRSTGYPLCYAKGSAGGYKDWCIETLGVPAFTVEAGAERFVHPIGKNEFWNLLLKNKNALYDLSQEYISI